MLQRRQGLNFVVRGLSEVGPSVQQMADAKARGTSQETVRPWRLEWIERTFGPEVIKQGVPRGPDASSGYANPNDVLADPALTQSEKRDVLQRWALDAYLIELALSKGLPVSHQSRLDDVIDALIDLDDNKTRGNHARCAAATPNRPQGGLSQSESSGVKRWY